MKGMRFIVLLLTLAGISLCVAGQTKNAVLDSTTKVTQPNAADRFDPKSSNYIIGASDLLAINVWKEQELSRAVPVRPDGKISLPLVGDLTAAGLTPVALQDVITRELKKYLENPEVTVIVQEARSQHFNIMGEVNKPGSYILTGPLTVLDGLAQAGGFRDFAKLKKIYVLRIADNGQHQRLPFNYKEVIKGHKLSENIQLQPGDTIVVP